MKTQILAVLISIASSQSAFASDQCETLLQKLAGVNFADCQLNYGSMESVESVGIEAKELRDDAGNVRKVYTIFPSFFGHVTTGAQRLNIMWSADEPTINACTENSISYKQTYERRVITAQGSIIMKDGKLVIKYQGALSRSEAVCDLSKARKI